MPPRGSPTRISSSPARSRRSSTGDPARAARSKGRPTTTSASPTSSTTSRPDPVAAGSEPIAGVRAPRITCPFCGLANAAVARASGWVAATFGEVANRADFILIVGRDPTRGFPRFVERLVDNPTPLYREARPIVAVLGEAPDIPVGDPALRIDVPPEA